MSDNLKSLYHEVILKHNSDPQNFKKREDAKYIIEAYNPVCGDQFKLYFDLDGNTISNLSFHGYGCAISKSSASILTTLLNGKKVEEFININDLFNNVLSGKPLNDKIPEELLAFTPVIAHPGRIKCVTLGWDSLTEFLNSEK